MHCGALGSFGIGEARRLSTALTSEEGDGLTAEGLDKGCGIASGGRQPRPRCAPSSGDAGWEDVVVLEAYFARVSGECLWRWQCGEGGKWRSGLRGDDWTPESGMCRGGTRGEVEAGTGPRE